jgi:DNA-sulfur modification-associated
MTGVADESSVTLDQLKTVGSGERPVLGTYGPNMGNMTITARFPVAELTRISVVANGLDAPDDEEVAQRPLDTAHATKLAQFILKGLVTCACRLHESRGSEPPRALASFREKLSTQPYFSLPPLIASLRDAGVHGKNLRAEPVKDPVNGEHVAVRFWMRQDQLLYIIDGQHRRKAIELVMEFLEEDVLQRHRYSRKNLYGNDGLPMPPEDLRAWDDVYHVARTEALVGIEIHLGLMIDQERQLFHDTNNLGKKVAPSLALAFDQANLINQFIKSELSALFTVVDHDVAVGDWKADPGSISRKDMVAINAHLFLNRTNAKGAKQSEVDPRRAIAIRFWRTVAAIPDVGMPGARDRTVAAQSVVLKALGKLMYDLSFGRAADMMLRDKFLASMASLDFSHRNPMWEYYNLSADARTEAGLNGLYAYLAPTADGVNRDVGARDSEGRMRFGAKHNDIIPILGDMFRWRLGLPNRHTDVAV